MLTLEIRRRTARRAVLAALLLLLLSGLAGVGLAQAANPCGFGEVMVLDENNNLVCVEWEDQACPLGEDFNPITRKCEPLRPIDCGPNPYLYNAIGGHWQRDFNQWCYTVNQDYFEIFFHKLDYGEAQGQLSRLGLGGLSRDQQIRALLQRGYGPQATGYIPVVTSTPPAPTFPMQDCGANPYKFNPFQGHFERRFDQRCFPFTGDQNEISLHGRYLNQ